MGRLVHCQRVPRGAMKEQMVDRLGENASSFHPPSHRELSNNAPDPTPAVRQAARTAPCHVIPSSPQPPRRTVTALWFTAAVGVVARDKARRDG